MSLRSKLQQFIIPTNLSKSSKMIAIPPARCDLALSKLDEIDSERLLKAHSGDNDETSAECSYTTNTSLKNRKENRWTDILAYDHSLLPGSYLNASLIPPFPSDKPEGKRRTTFIASQAPLPHTLATFYEKVIKSNTRLIVNLTPFRERGRTKADEYWPLQEEQIFKTTPTSAIGQYSIRQSKKSTMLNEKLQATLYSLEISNISQEGENSAHEIAVLHVTSWADFGNYPEDVFDTLLNIINEQHQKLTQTSPSDTSPIWIHCSAGVGRSGTVIAALMARELDVKDLHLSISSLSTPAQLMEASIEGATKLIEHERRYRPRMVQTGEQFEMVAVVVAKQLTANQHSS